MAMKISKLFLTGVLACLCACNCTTDKPVDEPVTPDNPAKSRNDRLRSILNVRTMVAMFIFVVILFAPVEFDEVNFN